MKSLLKKVSSKVKTGVMVLTLLGAQTLTAAAPFIPSKVVADPPGNNGTLQVHEKGSADFKKSNEPHVCVFNFEAFGLDHKQTGNVHITNQAPTQPKDQEVLTIPLATDNGGDGSTSPYVNDTGSIYQLPNGHYKATLDDKFGTDPGNKAKSKVFWVSCGVTPVKPGLATQVSSDTVAAGSSVTDLATFTPTDANGDVSGNVKFYVCGPSASNPDCTTGGIRVGGSVAVDANQASSDAYKPLQSGHYCFRAEFTSDDTTAYLDTSHTNTTTECFNVPKTVKACVRSTGTTDVTSQNLQGFDFSETRSTGHYVFTPTGLHIYTEGTTSTDKVAAYKAVNVALTDVGDTTLDYTSNSGIMPGYQLVVDFNHDGTPDGILVGEPNFYGNNWWLSTSASQFVKDGAPHNGGGNGSQWYGTLNEWLQAFPDAQVQAFGFSLGSGVLADGVLHSIDFGCHTYKFTAPTTGTIKVTKVVHNYHGGTAQPGDFSLYVGNSKVTSGATNTFDSGHTYTVSENGGPYGYTQDSLSCKKSGSDTELTKTFTLNSGDQVSCVIVNKDIAPTLKLIKHVVGGGSAHDWTLTASAANHPTLTGLGDTFGAQTAFANAPYLLGESGPDGYTAGSWTCSDGYHSLAVTGGKVTLPLGKNVICEITNTRDTGTVKVVKQLKPSNDNGRFDLHINGPTNYTAINQGNNGTTGTRTVGTGSYTVSESAYGNTSLSNYASTYVCKDGERTVATGNGTTSTSFTVAKGHNIVCTFTNTRYGSISGTKYEVNADGHHVGVVGGVQICIDNNHNGKCDPNETSTTTDKNGHFSFSQLLAGTYRLIENIGNGWTQIFGDGNVTIGDGQNAAHDFGNFKNASISGYKWNDANGDGKKQRNESKLSNWQIKLYKGFQLVGSTTTDNHGDYRFDNLAPGTYTVCEVQQNGWTQTYPNPQKLDWQNFFGCHIVKVTQSGHDYCNTDFGNQGHGSITVIKNVDDGLGHVTQDVSTWNWNIDGSGNYTTGSGNSQDVVAGNHTVSEVQKPGYHVTASSCDQGGDVQVDEFRVLAAVNLPTTSLNVNVAPGQDVVCTFTNTRDTGTITVVKQLFPANDPGRFDLNVDGSAEATAVGNGGTTGAVTVATGTHAVSETAASGTDMSNYDSTWSCSNEQSGKGTSIDDITVDADEDITCTFTNQHKVVPQVLGESTTAGPQLTDTGLPILVYTLAAIGLLGSALFIATRRASDN